MQESEFNVVLVLATLRTSQIEAVAAARDTARAHQAGRTPNIPGDTPWTRAGLRPHRLQQWCSGGQHRPCGDHAWHMAVGKDRPRQLVQEHPGMNALCSASRARPVHPSQCSRGRVRDVIQAHAHGCRLLPRTRPEPGRGTNGCTACSPLAGSP